MSKKLYPVISSICTAVIKLSGFSPEERPVLSSGYGCPEPSHRERHPAVKSKTISAVSPVVQAAFSKPDVRGLKLDAGGVKHPSAQFNPAVAKPTPVRDLSHFPSKSK